MTPLPTSFTQVEGWREDFAAAWEAQDTARAEALFPDLPHAVLGVRVRALTLRDWAVLHAAGNRLLCAGTARLPDVVALCWVLRPRTLRTRLLDLLPGDWIRRLRKRLLLVRLWLAGHASGDAAVDAALDFLDAAFLDSPGAALEDSANPARTFNPVHMPARHFALSLCAEIAAVFPGITPGEILDMPLAQMWQWLHEARAVEAWRQGESYRQNQPTDRANRRALAKLNALRAAPAAQQAAATFSRS